MAASAADYASQWPVTLPGGESGLYRVELGPGVYRVAGSHRLADVDLLDGAGRPVPAQLLQADAPAPAAAERTPVPWFALPSADAARTGDIALVVERAADGSVRRVDTRVGAGEASTDASTAWLVDASAVDGRIDALLLDWSGAPEPLQASYRVEASDDLRQWRVLQSRATLVDLSRDGQRLRQRRVPVDAAARYLRLVPLSGVGGLALTAVEVERAGTTRRASPTQWRELAARPAAGTDAPALVYELDGRFPVDTVDVALATGSTAQWRLYSRERADAPWVHRAGPWLGYRIGADQRSAPQPLAGVVRDRYWKLEGAPAPAQPPVLRLGWRPEQLLFVAGDSSPHRLVAGSARATRAPAPVAQSLQAIRATRGAHWQPPLARLGDAQALGGAAALRPGRDWTTWLLWALLGSGAALVAWFALGLLRERPGRA